VGLAGDGGSDSVGDSDAESTTLEAVSHGQDSIGGLSGLGDEDANIVTEDGSLAIQEITGQFGRDWDLGQLLKDRARLFSPIDISEDI
jgi:hypothetical protein